MTDHTRNGIKAVIKALETVVLPAIDTTDPMAREQLQLSVDYLRFLDSRIDNLHARARLQLQDVVELVGSVLDIERGDVEHVLSGRMASERLDALERLENPAATTAQLWEANARLSASLSEMIRAFREPGAMGAGIRDAIERAVVHGSEWGTRFERTWYLPLGFDHDEESLPALEDVLVESATDAGRGR